MRSPAVRAMPMPYSKTCDTFRASDASAIGAGLGRKSFADDFETSSVPQGLVAELLSEHRPSGIQHGFCHPCLHQLGRAHVAHDDAAVLTHKPRRILVQEALPAVLGFGVQRGSASLLSALLCQSQRRLMLPIERRHLDLATVRERSKVFQAEINSNLRSIFPGGFRHLDLQIEIPAPAGVLGKASGLDLRLVRDGAREPQTVFATEHHDGAGGLIDPKGPRRVKRHPPKRSLFAGSPCRTVSGCSARVRKLPGDSAEGVAMEA